MNLIDENVERESEEKQKKIIKIIIITIIMLICIVILILGYSAIKKKNTFKLSVDNQSQTFKSEMFMMTDKKNLYMSEKGEIYISVRNMANMLNVEYLNDEYKGMGEDVTKCHIKTGNEYTSYIAGSSTIYKVRDNKAKNEELLKEISKSNSNNNGSENIIIPNDYEYEYFTIEDGVRYVDNEIYASKSAIELGFNVSIAYDQKNKSVSVYTLDGLTELAKNNVGALVASEDIEYYNKKLLKYGLTLIKNSNGDLGITKYINYQEGNHLISCKYSDIKFIESLSCFIVTTSGTKKEQGILKIDLDGDEQVKTLINPKYQEINQLTDDGKLYVIKENERYGLLEIYEDENSEVKTKAVLKSEYQTIGLQNYSQYEEMTNKYLINGKYIPVKRDDKWGVVTTDGTVIVVPNYDVVGCNTSESGKPVVCIPELNEGADVLVFGMAVNENQDKQSSYSNSNKETKYIYSMINTVKKEKIGYDAVEIYSTYQNNQKNYIMVVETQDKSTYRINIYEGYGDASKKSTTEASNANGESNQNAQN